MPTSASAAQANVVRDIAVHAKLLDERLRVATVWESALRKSEQLAASIKLISAWLRSDDSQIEIGEGSTQPTAAVGAR